ncbi:MAG TPA: hypothetical protein VEX13_11595 [Chloroflexia bacterium]|nr:hypothetical protein [Chloroflexia bacterium]
MRRFDMSLTTKLMVLGCLVAMVMLAVIALSSQGGKSQSDVAVPESEGTLPGPRGTIVLAPLNTHPPEPQGTIPPELIFANATPSMPTATPYPTLVTLATPVLIQPNIALTMTIGKDIALVARAMINSVEAIVSWTWAPTGDKVLYVTTSGNLYWAYLDGTGATLLHTYERDMIFDEFLVQGPMTNTLLVRHVGPPQGMIRAPGHIDVIRFAPGQAPTLEEVPDPGPLYDIHWWSPDRASGTLYLGYRGSQKIVTVDANGHIVEEHRIPYLQSSAVQPGGEWLAYGTGQGSPNLPFYGSDSTTAYLLNLKSGRRLQISATGKGHIWNWSPDGTWLLMADEVNGKGQAMLSSPDGQVRFIMPDFGSFPVWSPDSTHLAFAEIISHSPDGHVITSWDSNIFIVDIAGKTISKADISGLPRNAPSTLLPAQPQWSPDGSQLGFLALDHIQGASAMYSEREPALYTVSWP